MVYKLIVKPDAETDLDKAFEWYSERNENLRLQLLNEVEKVLEKIQNNPEHYQKRYREIRIIFMKTFPYGFIILLKKTQSLFMTFCTINKTQIMQNNGYNINII